MKRNTWQRFTPHSVKRQLTQFLTHLYSLGLPEREVARAYLYADCFGLDALTGESTVIFDIPDCNDWDCLNPTHQRIHFE